MAVFHAGAAEVQALAPARFVLIGGAPVDGERHIWWNFVASTPERIERAKADWKNGRFGIVPSEDWDGGIDPWTAPTAWTAWSLAALGERPAALHLMAALRRAATPAGMLPERVDARTGIPTSTTPLAWSHAFAILALRQLWPAQAGRRQRPSQ